MYLTQHDLTYIEKDLSNICHVDKNDLNDCTHTVKMSFNTVTDVPHN